MNTSFSKQFSLLLVFCLGGYTLLAQQDSLSNNRNNEDIIEDYIQNLEEEGDFDFNTAFDSYSGKPININEATAIELEELGLLTSIQINDLCLHIENYGKLIAIQELQSIPSFDLQTIYNILPFITISGQLDDYHVPLSKLVTKGSNEIYIRWQRILEEQKGFAPRPDATQYYLGDPNKYYIRFQHKYENRLSYGITMEKDAGEEFFSGSNKQGFDFYSAHFFLKDYNRYIKSLAIGDYTVSFGQGLIRYSGFGAGKSSYVTSIKRSRRTLEKYSSVNEANFMRGIGATIGLGPNLEITAFASNRNRDANILLLSDTTETGEEDLTVFTSIQNSGFHRTPAEIEDENAINQTTLGGSIRYQKRNAHLALNGLFDSFNKIIQRKDKAYNRFFFSGNQLNLSLDYSYIYKNLHFFGETASGINGSVATINGLLIGLDRKTDLAVLHRYFPRDYHSIDANPFSEKNRSQ